MENNLPLLKDIHLPPEITMFPLGYWWIVLIAIIIAVIAGYKLFLWGRKKSKKRYALRLLQKAENNDLKSACEISNILRRICLYKYPEAKALYNRPWIDFLNEHCSQKLEGKAAELLIYAPYAVENVYLPQDYDSLRNFCKLWIGENL